MIYNLSLINNTFLIKLKFNYNYYANWLRYKKKLMNPKNKNAVFPVFNSICCHA